MPTRARPRPLTPDFETDSAFGFEFYLASKLHMTVAEVRQRMTQREFVEWSVFYGRRAQQMELEQKAAARRR